MAGIEDVAEDFVEAEHEKCHCISAERNGGDALLELKIGALGDAQAFGHHLDCQAALLAGERNVGPKSALGLPRGSNNLWSKGGLIYAPPVR